MAIILLFHKTLELVEDFSQRGVNFVSLNESIDTSTPTGQLIFHIFCALAQFERELIKQRTMAGLEAARARQQVLGRPKGLGKTAQQKAQAAASLYRDGSLNVRAICAHLHISLPTLYRYLRYQGIRLKAEQPEVAIFRNHASHIMKKLPIGIQNIREILTEGYVYVDKTSFAHQLIQNGKHYFLSRPRRFGKSLFLSTLEEIFKGNKELFQGCAIYQSDYDWQAHLVLYFDFSQIANRNAVEFEESLKRTLQEIAASYSLSITTPTIQEGLKALVVHLSTQQNKDIVVLTDEYDKPIIDRLENLEVAQANRGLLKDFFTTLKSLDRYLKFTFTTGVSKFSQVSLFSGPNNLQDITIDPSYGGIMGYSEQELRQYFTAHIQAITQARSNQGAEVSEQEVFLEIQQWYNGYRFAEDALAVYNPYSTLLFFKAARAKGYWYSSGTPSFLINQVKNHPQTAIPLVGISARESELMDISSLVQIDLKALMFQTGYLTIQSYDPLTRRYTLGFPNQEVREAFIDSLIKAFAPLDLSFSNQCQASLKEQDLSAFFEQLQVALASFPYQLFIDAQERTYQAILLGLMNGMNLAVVAESATNLGRVDLVVEMPRTTYLMELKVDSSAEAALAQIKSKRYYEPYLSKGKQVALIGISLSSKERNIKTWQGEVLDETGQLIKTLKPSGTDKRQG